MNHQDYPFLSMNDLSARRHASKRARADRRMAAKIAAVIVGGGAGLAVLCACLWGIAG